MVFQYEMQSPYSYTKDTKLEQPSFYKNLIISPTDLNKDFWSFVIQLAVTFLTDHLLYDFALSERSIGPHKRESNLNG